MLAGKFSFHRKKGWLQKVTPFFAISFMWLISFYAQDRYLWPELSAFFGLISCTCYFMSEIAFFSHADSPAIAQHRAKISDFYCGLGSSFSYIISLSILQPDAMLKNFFDRENVFVLGLLFLIIQIIILRLIHRGVANQRPPLCCYGYWPSNPFLRLPSLLLYYSTSNGLFSLFLIVIGLFLLQLNMHLYNDLQSIDVLAFCLYVLFYLGIARITQNFKTLSSVVQKYSSLILLTGWIIHIIFTASLNHFSWHFISFRTYIALFSDLGLAENMLTDNVNLFSTLSIWGYFWGSYWAKQQPSWPTAGSVFLWILGVLSSFFILRFVIYTKKSGLILIAQGFLCLGVIVFFFLNKTPLHQIDAPWHNTQRQALNIKRWLLSMVLAPLSLIGMIAIGQPQLSYRIIDAFGSLIYISIFLLWVIQLIELLINTSCFQLIQFAPFFNKTLNYTRKKFTI